jgi:uncharacterized Tic20 family protein
MIAIPIILITVFSNIPVDTIINDGDFMRHHFSIENITGIAIVAIVAIILFVGLKVAEFFLIIYASVKASNGEKFQYPLTISFIK